MIWEKSRESKLNKRSAYQLSAEDVGCWIWVEAIPLEDGFFGTAFGEFGPITIEPS